MNRRGWIGSTVLIVTVLAFAGGLAVWKRDALADAGAAAAGGAEPAEAVAVALAAEREHRASTTSIGTVLAVRSISLRNELPGTVARADLTPGKIVEPGTLLVEMDVSVESAELKAFEAQAALATALFERIKELAPSGAASANEVDRLRTERDVALAQIERLKAVIARKTIRAPFRARVGMSDVHAGQYLEEGTLLTTLQGVDDALHVDFTVAQRVAASVRPGDVVDVLSAADGRAAKAEVVAVDARVDPATRNAAVRARMSNGPDAPAPGAAVRVRLPFGAPAKAVAVPVNALRKGPGGDHVFVVAPGKDGQPRARVRPVRTGPMVGNEVLVLSGLTAGERVAASGSFKLRDEALVSLPPDAVTAAITPTQE
jgi:membrane fusion protein (multidrug efflux system)